MACIGQPVGDAQSRSLHNAQERLKLSPLVREIHGDAAGDYFKHAYALESLGQPPNHIEADLHRGLLGQLRNVLIELGRDFRLVGSELPVQVGGRDFALDMLFFRRGLNCPVLIELKADRFEPEHLGKLNFYLEAIDRDASKSRENRGNRRRPCRKGPSK